jgi:hypothetical protein
VLAFLLVWVASQWDAVESLYHNARGLWVSIWEKVKEKGVDKLARRNSDKSSVVADDTISGGMRV